MPMQIVEKSGEGLSRVYGVTVPANTRATVYVPTSDPKRVKEGGKPIVVERAEAGYAAISAHVDEIKRGALDLAAFVERIICDRRARATST